MKKPATTLCILFLLTQAFLLPVSAFCTFFSQDAARDLTALAAETETAYDGYLVGLSDDAEAALSDDADWESVVPGVIRTDDLDFARALLADGTAEYVETNDVVHLFAAEAESVQDGWAYEAADAAYGEMLGLSGAGVRIAVIDTGVDRNNMDLRDARINTGYDYVAETNMEMCDPHGHGTQVTQMIAADRNDRGGTGIARDAEIVPLRCFDENGDTNYDDLARAICDAADGFRCDIINMSWGFAGNSQTIQNAVQCAYQKGCILVAAAGNVDTRNPQGTVYYPAAYDEVIGVGSVNSAMQASPFSQQTVAVSISAPGEAVPVWYDEGEKAVSGTSFACPCAAAMLALAKERLPSLDGAAALTLVRERAVDRGTAGYDTAYGYGTLDVRSLLEQSWGFCRQEENSTVLSGWLSRSEDGVSVAALYEQSGRMAACAFLPQQEGCSFSYAFPSVTGELQCKLFCLDADYCPAKGFNPDNEGVTTP